LLIQLYPAGGVSYAGVTGDPRQCILAGRVRSQCLKQIVAAIGMDFVKANEGIGFTVRAAMSLAGRICIRPRPLVNLPGDDRVGGDQLFGQVEIVGSLPFVIGEDETVIALRGRPDKQTIQRSQDQVRGLPVLFCPTADGQIVPGPVTIKGVKNCLENVASIGLNGVEQRSVVQPAQLFKESRRWRRVDNAARPAFSTSARVGRRAALPSSPISWRVRTKGFENAR